MTEGLRQLAHEILQQGFSKVSVFVAESGGVSPPFSHRTVRERLRSYGSYHSAYGQESGPTVWEQRGIPLGSAAEPRLCLDTGPEPYVSLPGP